jgi:hypothetical protein
MNRSLLYLLKTFDISEASAVGLRTLFLVTTSLGLH